MLLIAIIFPWLSFFLRGKIFAGLFCLFLQITLIGWLPAAIWAVVSLNSSRTDKKLKEMEARLLENKLKNNSQ